MALVSESTVESLGNSMSRNRISFREDLNDTRHCDDDLSSDCDSDIEEEEEENDGDDETSPSKDPDTREIASMERKALKYRKSLTMLDQLARTGAPPKEHLLAAKKSIDDLTAWVNASALGESDEDDDDD
ncbi:hypothetical protein BX616_002548 [Lobosporangium transversale]|nr:hypothetical protein BX616_002548 [Lobosporangium transversale]